MRSALGVIIVASLATGAAARPTVTTGFDLEIGSHDVGSTHGFVAPGGHFDVGASLGAVRLQLELDRGLWSPASVPAGVVADGAFTRVGAGLRWYWMDLPYTERGALRAYAEAGVGNQWLATPSLSLSRHDLELGFGMTQEAHVSKIVLGGNFGIRVLVADPVAPMAAARATMAPAPHTDVALFFVLGGVFGT